MPEPAWRAIRHGRFGWVPHAGWPAVGDGSDVRRRATRLPGLVADPPEVDASRGDLRTHPHKHVGLQLMGELNDSTPVEGSGRVEPFQKNFVDRPVLGQELSQLVAKVRFVA